MPRLIINGTRINVRWLKEWDKQIILIGKTFKKGKVVDWQAAFDQGYFKGLPVLRLYDYSKRYTTLKMRKKPGFLEKRREYNRLHRPPDSTHGTKLREELYRKTSTISIRKKLSCPPRELWTEDQHTILKAIISSHPRGRFQIDWEGVMQDNLLKRLPQKYRQNLPLLRKYYHGLCQYENPALLQKRREDALRWKRENKARYRLNMSRRREKLIKVANEVLLKKIPLFS